MITPKLVGFFRELRHGQPVDGPSLHQAVRDTANPDEDRILSYLENGLRWCICLGGDQKDVLDPLERWIPASAPRRLAFGPVILTDGEWVWPGDLPYYVRTYHARLPEEFVEHMKSRNWAVPAEGSVDLSQLKREGVLP